MAKTHTHPIADDAVRAEREGDFCRARALSHMVVAGQSRGRQGVGQADILGAARARIERLRIDPRGWQAGLVALLAYASAWIYALLANR